jgi:hypothetical protein
MHRCASHGRASTDFSEMESTPSGAFDQDVSEELTSSLSLNHCKVGNAISATITRNASRVRIALDP